MILVNIILGMVGIVAFLWLMVGPVIGLVWALVYWQGAKSKGKKKAKRFPILKWALVTVGGLGLLTVTFVGYAILSVMQAIFGLR